MTNPNDCNKCHECPYHRFDIWNIAQQEPQHRCIYGYTPSDNGSCTGAQLTLF